jgi:hypothetical protein
MKAPLPGLPVLAAGFGGVVTSWRCYDAVLPILPGIAGFV